MRNHNMLDYIRAEFYKVLHRKYTWWFLLAMLAGAGLLAAGWAYTNSRGNDIGFSTGATTLVMMLSIGLYCTLITGDIVFSDQYKFNTLKNEVSYCISRTCIYLGKFFVSCVVAVVSCIIIMGVYLGLCAVILPIDPTADGEVMRMVGISVLNALPLWLGAQAVTMFCMSFFKGSTVASFVFIGIIMLVPTGLKLMAMLIDPVFATVREFTLSAPFDNPDFIVSADSFVHCLITGAGWFIAATAGGLLAFRKREIS